MLKNFTEGTKNLQVSVKTHFFIFVFNFLFGIVAAGEENKDLNF